ncbi:helix-turn-helix domain-containing protein [Rhodococcus sp. KBW08]|nr:helix-turn-helix domain-containing protein [Rhodococcus sp. KBW08]
MNRLEVTERIEIQRTLRQTGGNRVKAARILGISRSSLYRKMNSYGLKTE